MRERSTSAHVHRFAAWIDGIEERQFAGRKRRRQFRQIVSGERANDFRIERRAFGQTANGLQKAFADEALPFGDPRARGEAGDALFAFVEKTVCELIERIRQRAARIRGEDVEVFGGRLREGIIGKRQQQYQECEQPDGSSRLYRFLPCRRDCFHARYRMSK
jgi:hypothetical protein